MQNIGPYLVGAAFWIFIGAAAVAGIITDYKRRRAVDDFSPADMQILISPAGWAVSKLVGGGVLFLMRPSRH